MAVSSVTGLAGDLADSVLNNLAAAGRAGEPDHSGVNLLRLDHDPRNAGVGVGALARHGRGGDLGGDGDQGQVNGGREAHFGGLEREEEAVMVCLQVDESWQC